MKISRVNISIPGKRKGRDVRRISEGGIFLPSHPLRDPIQIFTQIMLTRSKHDATTKRRFFAKI